MIVDKKMAIAVSDHLLIEQKLQVVAFLTSGLVAQHSDVMGTPYEDFEGNLFSPLMTCVPNICCVDEMAIGNMHRRAISQSVRVAVFVDEWFDTAKDEARRAMFQRFDPNTVNVVGIALYAPHDIVAQVLAR